MNMDELKLTIESLEYDLLRLQDEWLDGLFTNADAAAMQTDIENNLVACRRQLHTLEQINLLHQFMRNDF